MSKFNVFVGAWILAAFLAIACVLPAIGMCFIENPNQVKHPIDATLIAAHPYSQSTGKYSSELRWNGRFQLEDGRTIDQNIDGFFYKNFMNGGEKPIKSWVAVSGWQLGKPDPTWVDVRDKLFLASFIGLCAMLFGMMMIPFTDD